MRTLFSYNDDPAAFSPFLMLDYGGPMNFEPTTQRRGVGAHPHRGFETVTIVYDGEVSHRDSSGGGGTIGPGDVQWMTAASGIVHEEFHSEAFARSEGPATRLQWGTGYLSALVDLAPQDAARIEQTAAQPIDEAGKDGGAFSGRSARVLQRLGRKLTAWNEGGMVAAPLAAPARAGVAPDTVSAIAHEAVAKDLGKPFKRPSWLA